MCYEAVIASSRGNDTTLTKSFIISLEGEVTNWYARLQLKSITSLGHLKDKFIVNFQGFQMELNTEKDFLSCQQYERKHIRLDGVWQKTVERSNKVFVCLQGELSP
jgi:hypothetical protein